MHQLVATRAEMSLETVAEDVQNMATNMKMMADEFDDKCQHIVSL